MAQFKPNLTPQWMSVLICVSGGTIERREGTISGLNFIGSRDGMPIPTLF